MSLTVKTAHVPDFDALAAELGGSVQMPKDYSHGVRDCAALVSFSGTVTRMMGAVTGRFSVSGSFTAAVPVLCSVCQCETMWRENAVFNEVFANTPADMDEWRIIDGTIDIEQAIIANIIGVMPMRITCKEDCSIN